MVLFATSHVHGVLLYNLVIPEIPAIHKVQDFYHFDIIAMIKYLMKAFKIRRGFVCAGDSLNHKNLMRVMKSCH